MATLFCEPLLYLFLLIFDVFHLLSCTCGQSNPPNILPILCNDVHGHQHVECIVDSATDILGPVYLVTIIIGILTILKILYAQEEQDINEKQKKKKKR